MEILLVDNQTKHLDKLHRLMEGHRILTVACDSIPADRDGKYDVIVLSGSSTNAVFNKRGVYKDEIDLIRYTPTPVIGICVGFELIVHTFGGNLQRLSGKIEGWETVAPTTDNPFISKESVVYEGHRWAVGDLPVELTGLARSSHGWELVRHNLRPVYGMQFHPEMDEGSRDGREIFLRLLKSFSK